MYLNYIFQIFDSNYIEGDNDTGCFTSQYITLMEPEIIEITEVITSNYNG